MKMTLGGPGFAAMETDALVLPEAEGATRPELADPLTPLYESGEITGKALELTLVHGVAGLRARRVVVAGVGKPEKADAALLRRVASASVRMLKGKGVKSGVFVLDGEFASAVNVAAVATGLITGAWEPDRHKTEKKESEKAIESFVIAGAVEGFGEALERGRIIGEALNL